jgi:hypothetical protein
MAMQNGRIVLASGGTIQMHSLRQWLVYRGLLEGLPTREMNNRMIDHLRREARDRTGHAPFLIEPTQEPIEYPEKYPFGEQAARSSPLGVLWKNSSVLGPAVMRLRRPR